MRVVSGLIHLPQRHNKQLERIGPVTHVRLWRVCTFIFTEQIVFSGGGSRLPTLFQDCPVSTFTNSQPQNIQPFTSTLNSSLITSLVGKMSIQSVRPLLKYVIVSYQVQLKDVVPLPDQEIRSNTFLCGAGGQERSSLTSDFSADTVDVFTVCAVYCLCGCVFTSQEKDLVFSLASFNLSPSQKHNFPKQIFHFDSCFRRYSLNRMCSVTLCCFIILAVIDPPVCC